MIHFESTCEIHNGGHGNLISVREYINGQKLDPHMGDDGCE